MIHKVSEIRARLGTAAYFCEVVVPGFTGIRLKNELVFEVRKYVFGVQGLLAYWIVYSLALAQSIWAHQFGQPGLFPAPKLTDLYRKCSMSTLE